MDRGLDKFKNWLLVNGRTPSTIGVYLSKLKMFFCFLGDKEIGEDIVIQFFMELRDKNSPSTINGYKDALKTYFEFIKIDVPLPKYLKNDKKLTESIDEKEFKEGIIYVVERIYQNPIKMKAILYFMFYTGIRVSEIETLKRKDIDLEKRVAKIYETKTRQERMVVFTNETREMLKHYFNIEAEETNAFNTKTGALKKLINKMKPHFKDINIHPHLFRHSFGTHLHKRGVDTLELQRLMGHKSINSTMRYVHTDVEHIKKVYDEKINSKKKR